MLQILCVNHAHHMETVVLHCTSCKLLANQLLCTKTSGQGVPANSIDEMTPNFVLWSQRLRVPFLSGQEGPLSTRYVGLAPIVCGCTSCVPGCHTSLSSSSVQRQEVLS